MEWKYINVIFLHLYLYMEKKFMSMSEKTFIFQRKPEKWKRFLFRMVIIQFTIFPCFVTSISFAKHTFAFLVPCKEFLFCISSVYFFHSFINNCKKKKQFTRVAYCILIIMFIWFLQVLDESFSNSQCGACRILHQKTKSDTENKTHLNAKKPSSLDGFQLISRFCYFFFFLLLWVTPQQKDYELSAVFVFAAYSSISCHRKILSKIVRMIDIVHNAIDAH